MKIDFTGDKFAEVYGEKYTNKIEYLQKVITEYYSDERFNVMNFEAGLGKSFYTDKIIKEYFHSDFDWKNMYKFLVVKKFNEESEKSADFLEDEKDGFLKGYAVAITAKSWNEKWQYDIDGLASYRVIYISHQRYIQWCDDIEVREIICKDRDTLIIDEKIIFPIYTYTDAYYMKVMSILPRSLRSELEKVCKKLNDFLIEMEAENKTNKIERFERKIHHATLDNFKKKLENNWQNIKGNDNKKIVEEFVKGLDVWYNTKCLYNAGAISGYNRNHKHWMLKNNIILDASAKIDGIYSANPKKYHLQKQSRIIDHSNCKFTQVNFNSSAAKIDGNAEYLPELVKKVVEHKKEEDKVLIVCRKKYAKKIKQLLSKICPAYDIWMDKEDKDNDPDYNEQSIAISWYGNLIGKNWAREFTQCWLVSTPNIPMEQYLLHWMMYTGEELGNRKLDIIRKKGEDQGKFKNEEFRAIQKGYIACEMYQALKRIQRNEMPKGEFFIVNDNDGIINMIIGEMYGAELEKEKMEFDFVKENEEKKQAEKKPNQVQQFIDYVLNLAKGEYKKKDISKALNITKLNRVLDNDKVKNLEYTNKIKVTTRNIVVL